ncbi:hypothetical protein BVRB_6g139700 [Beta vulgaris subsp. vulgaris]|nr:hypothetical protein BVRB_6g139700 [Beta vulgaris subsp. vulgaris]
MNERQTTGEDDLAGENKFRTNLAGENKFRTSPHVLNKLRVRERR